MAAPDAAVLESAERYVETYLDSFLHKPESGGNSPSSAVAADAHEHALPSSSRNAARFDRVFCCESSRSLYCLDCCKLLVPDESLPASISLRKRPDGNGGGRPLKLPFNLHIILDDRRGSSTGLHAVALLNNTDDINGHDVDSPDSFSCSDLGSVTLIDVARNDGIPSYSQDDGSTFLLFPSHDSVPLESVASRVNTLVVLDCKWTKSSIRQNAEVSKLKKVHLTHPPGQSYFWRWHNAGPGMISTIEAIFYAAFEVSQTKGHQLTKAGSVSQEDSEDSKKDLNNLVHILWLFAHQRAAIFQSAKDNGVPAPCTDEGKDAQRALRKQQGTWRQLRHEEDERRLRERNERNERKKQSAAECKTGIPV